VLVVRPFGAPSLTADFFTLVDAFEGVSLVDEISARFGVTSRTGVDPTGLVLFDLVGDGGAAVEVVAALALDEAVPCINLEADDGAVTFVTTGFATVA
jgi:hypothetical protein